MVKDPPASEEDARDASFNPWVRKIPSNRKWQPTPVFVPGKSHGQRNLAGNSPWGCEESDTPEQLNTHASISKAGIEIQM